MTQSELNTIQKSLGINLPEFYVETMLNYPFSIDSFGEELMLPPSVEVILDCNAVFDNTEQKFAVGSDGGEFIYYIKLNGEETVYIFDLERSDYHSSVKSSNWSDYLDYIKEIHQEIEEDAQMEKERKLNKKWWQFWI